MSDVSTDAMLERLDDPELNRLHPASVAWHSAKIADLRTRDLQRDIFESSRRRHRRKLEQEMITAQQQKLAA